MYIYICIYIYVYIWFCCVRHKVAVNSAATFNIKLQSDDWDQALVGPGLAISCL